MWLYLSLTIGWPKGHMMMMTLKSLCRIRAVGWEKMAEATPQMIGLIIIVLTLDFYSLAEKNWCPRCPNSHGLVNCKMYRSNCVALSVDVQVREILVSKCNVSIIVQGKPLSLSEFPIVRSIHGSQYHDIFIKYYSLYTTGIQRVIMGRGLSK